MKIKHKRCNNKGLVKKVIWPYYIPIGSIHNSYGTRYIVMDVEKLYTSITNRIIYEITLELEGLNQ